MRHQEPDGCPGCGGPMRPPNRGRPSVSHCRQCGLQRWLVAPDWSQRDYYDSLYARWSEPGDAEDIEEGFGAYVLGTASASGSALQSAPHFRAVLPLLDRMPGGRVLDVGCGEGWLVRIMLEKGWDAYGCDISSVAIDEAQSAGPSTRFFVGTPTDLPQDIGMFDCVTATHVLEHLPDPRRLLDSLGNRLRPGGWGLFTTPNRHRVGLMLRRLRRLPPQTWDLPPHHLTWWSRRALRSFLSNYFEEMAITCSRYGRLGLLDSLLSWRWGPHLHALCRGYGT